MKPRTRHTGLILLSIATTVWTSVSGKTVGSWDLNRLYETPKWEQTELASKDGVKGILYDSIQFKGKRVQVFAYYSAPEGPVPDGGWPAVVCIHGGGGSAFENWVKKWNQNGFAAISFDQEGHIPVNKEPANKKNRARKSTPNPGPRRIGGFDDYKEPIEDQWYYHSVAQIILAHSLIRSFPEVNPDKTGFVGLSWGGTLASTVMGVDDRYQFGIASYGSGYMPRNRHPEDKHRFINEHFDGSLFFGNVSYPTMWVNSTNDFYTQMPATQQSYRAVKGPVTIRFQHKMPHGHGPIIANREVYAFAKSIVAGGAPLLKVTKPEVKNSTASVKGTPAGMIKNAQLLYTMDAKGKWEKKEWLKVDADINGSTVSANIPKGTFAICFNVTDQRGLMVSSEYLQLGD
ncbi:alpha/beta hydrolase family protein [Haloferula sp.]|uniref:alpha/beta hydrolase family protein n=1 Tax=Haloferula sp. TaxID=2497595 RepID=UPI003C716425